jgi:hypothetical protein
MVSPSFAGFGFARRYDADPVPAHRVRDKQQPVFHHADRYESLLSVLVAIIRPLDREAVVKHLARQFKPYSMIAPVARSLGVEPFENRLLASNTA